jgi:AcrR family transcriptional regulator
MTRGTAAQRRDQILAVAKRRFSEVGLYGVSVETIAGEVGISEPYVFRLFGSKRALFIAVVTDAFDEVTEAITAAIGDATGTAAMTRMADQYVAMLDDRQRLLLMMQGLAACGDTGVRDAVRAAFGRMWERVVAVSHMHPVQAKAFIAVGMLQNNLAALDVDSIPDEWARQARARVPEAAWQFPI